MLLTIVKFAASASTMQDTPSKKLLPERKQHVPPKAQPYTEARPNSKQLGPIERTIKRRKTKSSQVINESILGRSLDKLTTHNDRIRWYQAAICRRDGRDVDINRLKLVELMEMFDNPNASYQAMYQDVENSNNMMTVEPPEHKDNGAPLEGPSVLSTPGKARNTLGKGKQRADLGLASGVQQRLKAAGPPACFQNPPAATHPKPHVCATAPSGALAHGPNTPLARTSCPHAMQLSNTSLCTTVKPSSSTAAKSLTLTSSKPSASTPACNVTASALRTNVVGSPRKALISCCSEQPKAPQSHNAKHPKLQRKRVGPNRSSANDVFCVTDTNDAAECGSETNVPGNEVCYRPVRKQAKLALFGKLRWLVKAVSIRVRIQALKENPYVDFTVRYSRPNNNGHMHPNGFVLDDWLPKEWGLVWKRHHPEKAVPRMEEKHVKWIYKRFSKMQTDAKAAVEPYIGAVYGLDCNKSQQENKKIIEDLGLDGFLSLGYFARVGWSFGYKNAKDFQPIPKGVFTLLATVIHVCIQDFCTREEVLSILNADKQLPWHNMFSDIYDDIEENNFQSFENYQMETFDRCHGMSFKKSSCHIIAPSRKFDPDTQEVYLSKVKLPDIDSGEDEMDPSVCLVEELVITEEDE
ncbi:hypothetical protein RHS04_07818 [Rhizoctonia solani]|uniref:Uncharacterized protein n=1 Tax=Rhizoctonia solani TaxID=456999 RepID=A0A8H7H128_9AGAM|nr:hypothetical protein RHS04_07818 [Rhizoctonia solani]